jgi:hypothetical protein
MRYVAEVWLEWPICRGSTLYRASARYKQVAWLKAKIAAMLLDLVLPRFYRDTDWSGRPRRYEFEYGIHFGVRQTTAQEKQEGVRDFLNFSMPGSRRFKGEHSLAHPLNHPLNEAQTRGYKL